MVAHSATRLLSRGLSTNYSVQKAKSSKFCMFWPVEMKQLQNTTVDVNVMPPNTDFARLGLGPVTPLVLTKDYIIITNTNTKPGPESFPAMINLPRFCWASAVSL